jgi:hypothetical protein
VYFLQLDHQRISPITAPPSVGRGQRVGDTLLGHAEVVRVFLDADETPAGLQAG